MIAAAVVIAYVLESFSVVLAYVLERFLVFFAYVLEKVRIFALKITMIAMYERELIAQLRQWSEKVPHKPLVIRGARQVGKSTLVREFGREFDVFIGFLISNSR